MATSSTNFPAKGVHRSEYAHWPLLALILVAAAALRLLFAGGPFGSDDLTYLIRAAEVARGEWTSADYNGALRYGFNLPAGVLMGLFGVSESTAVVWPMFCSLAEIAVVYFFALKGWGRGPAAVAASLLAVTPLHIASATRIHTDSVVALFLSLAFLLSFLGERSGRRLPYFAAGLSIGMVFWAKELAIITLFALTLYPLLWRRLPRGWFFFVAGGLVMLAAHLVLMTIIAGDPLHLMKTVLGQVSRDFIGAMGGEDDPFFYFRYLFLDLRHTWLIGPLAAVGMTRWLARRSGQSADGVPDATSFAVFWCLAVIAVLSFVPVSLSPLRFPMKQSNYLTLFLAPLVILAGYAVARIDRRLAMAAMVITAAGGVVLGALQQQAYRVFTSNGKAVVSLLRSNPDAHVFGSTNNGNIVHFRATADRQPEIATRFTYLTEIGDDGLAARLSSVKERDVFVVLDEETLAWGGRRSSITKPLPCWEPRGTLVPEGFGMGKWITQAASLSLAAIPTSLTQRVGSALGALLQPKPAKVYAVDRDDPDCLS